MSEERGFLPEDDRTKKFAVSTTEATAEEFKRLAESAGLSQKDLFAAMIDLYKANNAVAGVNKAKEIQDLTRHLKRVEEIFVAVVNELGDCREEAQRSIQMLQRQKNEEIDLLKQELQSLRSLYYEQRNKAEEYERTANEARRTIELIEKANARLDEENNVLRQRLQELEQLGEEKTRLLQENETLAARVLAYQAEIEKLKLEHDKEKFQLERALTAAADEQKRKMDAEMDALKARIHELETEKNKIFEELLRLRAER
ncbi:hypothetical protein CTH_10001 (plasmid) [Carboxydocella thermautotrophica]|nr:hypothetical protein CTH_10001 [Carboxydocella thermautotrophica]